MRSISLVTQATRATRKTILVLLEQFPALGAGGDQRLSVACGFRRPPLFAFISGVLLLITLCTTECAASTAPGGCTRKTLPLLSQAAALGSLGSDVLVGRAAAIADACAPDTHMPESTVCDASALCDTSAAMATRFICLDGEWRWTGSPSSSFCPGWRHCVWEEGSTTLSCDGRIRLRQGGPAPLGVPMLWDRQLQKITMAYEPALDRLPAFALEGAKSLRQLTVSNCMLTQLEPFALVRLRHLSKLDVSNNQLTQILSHALPVVGSLRFIDVQGNSGALSFPYPGLTPAMSYCGSDGPPTILPHGVGGCLANAPVTGIAGLPCHGVHCFSTLRYGNTCSDGTFVDQREVCDGVANTNPTCIAQEGDLCGFGAQYNSTILTVNSNATSLCDHVLACFPQRGVLYVRSGLVRFKPALAGRKQQALCPLPYADIPNHLYFIVQTISSQQGQTYTSAGATLNVWHFVNPGGLVIAANLSRGSSTTQCHFLYKILSYVGRPDEQYPTVPPYSTSTSTNLLATTSTNSSIGSNTSDVRDAGKQAVIVPVAAVGCIAFVILLVAFTVMLHRQRKRTALLLDALDNAHTKVPAATLIAAEERFQLQFAPLLPSDAAARYKALLVLPAQLQIGDRVLGKGAFGTVTLGSLQRAAPVTHGLHAASNRPLHGQMQADEVVAIKTTQADLSGPALTQLLLEARLHACLTHRNLVKLLAVQGTYLPVMLALEYCSGGNLRQELRRAANSGTAMTSGDLGQREHTGMSEVAQRDMAAQVAAGLQYLHSKLCIHRDVAARNVLLVPAREAGESAGPSGFVLKLADLGLSRLVCSEQDYYRSRSDDAVPIRWQCPTAVTTRVYTAKSDVYSFGVLLWEIYSGGRTPFAEFAAGEVVQAVRAGARLQRPSASTPQDIAALIHACTTLEAASRPSMASVGARLSGAWALEMAVGGGDSNVSDGDDTAAASIQARADEDNETHL